MQIDVPRSAGTPRSCGRVRRVAQHVRRFRRLLREKATTEDEQELLAAKMMGRWRSGAALALSPGSDAPGIAADPARNNDFATWTTPSAWPARSAPTPGA